MKKRKPRGTSVVFVLDTGYYGTARRLCQVGDEVSRLPSLNPLVLRPQTTAGEFKIITTAYCDGAMNDDMELPVEELKEVVLV
jgi:hypothetical protein